MTIKFINGTDFSVTVNVPGENNTTRGTYKVRADHVLLTATGETEVLDLVREGETLVGDFDGDRVVFTPK